MAHFISIFRTTSRYCKNSFNSLLKKKKKIECLSFLTDKKIVSQKVMLRRTTVTNNLVGNGKVPTRFLLPRFNKTENGKVNKNIVVVSDHVLSYALDTLHVSAIASEGFPRDREGRFVLSAHVERRAESSRIGIGFTSKKKIDSREDPEYSNFPGAYNGMNGITLWVGSGHLTGGNGMFDGRWDEKNYVSSSRDNASTEVVSILTIANDSNDITNKKIGIQYIVDGNEGPQREVSTSFCIGNDEIFPVVSLSCAGHKVEFLPFNQVKSRSAKIDELMKEFNDGKIKSVEFAVNDATMSELRDRVVQTEEALAQLEAKQNDKMKSMNDKYLEVKDQQLDLLQKQLDLEHAAHNKTRNLLVQVLKQNLQSK